MKHRLAIAGLLLAAVCVLLNVACLAIDVAAGDWYSAVVFGGAALFVIPAAFSFAAEVLPKK